MEVWEIYEQAVSEYKAKNFDAAMKLLDDVKTRAPAYRKAYVLESWIWRDKKNYVREFDALQKCIPLLDPSDPDQKSLAAEVFSTFSLACLFLCAPEEATKFFVLSARMTDDNAHACLRVGNAMFCANHVENFSAADFHALYDEYKKYSADIVPYPKKFYNHRKIRVGFLSGDFYAHSVVKWSWSLLTRLDKNLFSVYCYSAVEGSDDVTNYLSGVVDSWQEISDLKEEELAAQIRNDEIDILFDLSGHTFSVGLRVAAYRPASVQVSGVGYMNSIGLDCFDYFLSDVYCAGNPQAMRDYFTEKIIVMPHSHICYESEVDFEPAAEPPCIANGYVTFGTFNNFNKVTDSILHAWKKILDAVPKSRLILKAVIFSTEDGKTFVSKRLKNFGIDPSRVEMRGYTAKYMAEYDDVDIALDTFPYVGGVTTCEALYMGVPVVSLYGDRHGTRFGLSILKNVGLDELAVDSLDEYINRAIALASDWELLKILRKNLRGMMERSPLMDATNYTRTIEQVFITILRNEARK